MSRDVLPTVTNSERQRTCQAPSHTTVVSQPLVDPNNWKWYGAYGQEGKFSFYTFSQIHICVYMCVCACVSTEIKHYLFKNHVAEKITKKNGRDVCRHNSASSEKGIKGE